MLGFVGKLYKKYSNLYKKHIFVFFFFVVVVVNLKYGDQNNPKVKSQNHTWAGNWQTGRDREEMRNKQEQADGRMTKWRGERSRLERRAGGRGVEREERHGSLSAHTVKQVNLCSPQRDITFTHF